ncbi:MAG TPA: sensor histidine kinase [Thermoanaerobaculia bacterium]|jgi:signal transduction histidine kinase|nr:sensor histidine kinase [Thermoanaerobaculia bacterium]
MDDRKLLRLGGLAAWLMTGVPVVAEPPRSLQTFTVWAVVFLAFGVAFMLPRKPTLLLLALEATCVVTMVLLLCDGFEGSLLVLIAMQLATLLKPRNGALWIGVQSLLLFAAITVHWSSRPAILLTPPYLGFQLLAFFTIGALHRESATRAELARIAERLRISQELHDALGHHLTALSLNLETAKHQTDGAPRERIETAQSITKLLLTDVREIVAKMKSDENLAEALREMIGALPSPKVHLDIDERLTISDPEKAHILLRCAQEIVTNAARHSDARNLWIAIESVGGQLEIRARDDGRGADGATPGFGLRGMRERIERAGGRIELSTTPGSGFSIFATLP